MLDLLTPAPTFPFLKRPNLKRLVLYCSYGSRPPNVIHYMRVHGSKTRVSIPICEVYWDYPADADIAAVRTKEQ